MTTSISGTSGITFPDSSNQPVAAVGINQTWQNVTSQRAAGTTYTNDTGRPIMWCISNGGNNCDMYINGANLTNGGSYTNCALIVPAGATYKTVGNFIVWSELR